MTPAADRAFRHGIWRIHILHHAETREVWGAWLLEELAEHGHVLSPGTLYPALAAMVREGWLEPVGRQDHPRARRAYRLTRSGRALLATLRHDIVELHREVVLEHEASLSASRRRGKQKFGSATGDRTGRKPVKPRP